MYNLVFDKTANSCSIAIFDNSKEVASFEQKIEFGQSEALIPEINNSLDSSNLVFYYFDFITVCT